MAYVGKDYRDPLYGFISLDNHEQQIVDSFIFQRLRGIRQLGTTFLVYPTANHSRFEHSLGTLEISTRLFDVLTSDTGTLEVLGWDKGKVRKYRKLLRYASLLHDVGHAPFSHAAESLFPEGMRHEIYTYRIIVGHEPIKRVIEEDLGPNSHILVAEIATGTAKTIDNAFLSELLTGEFGSDRLDYLLRDSYHLVVSYGRFDAQRLLNTLKVRYNEEKNGPELIVDDGGVHSVEGLLLARYFMFLEVYFHKTRRILDIHLTDFIKSVYNEYSISIDDFLHMNDYVILNEMWRRKEEDGEANHGTRAFSLGF